MLSQYVLVMHASCVRMWSDANQGGLSQEMEPVIVLH